MTNPFKNLGVKIIESFRVATQKIKQVRAKRPKSGPAPQIPTIPTPKPQTQKEKTETAEQKATKQALWAIQYAMEHPEDKTAQQGRRKAIEYLSRAENLKKKGKLQRMNRESIAKTWMESDLASEKGQEARKEKKLRVFNENFNMDLNREQAELVGDLMESDSYQQLVETYAGIYADMIEAIGDAVTNNIDPIKIERTLNLFKDNDLRPEFSHFKNVLDLPEDDFLQLEADLYFKEPSENSEDILYKNIYNE